MNKLSTQKFMTLFNDILSDQKGVKSAKMFEAEIKGDEIDILATDREQQLFERLNGRNLLFMKKVEKAKQRILNGTFGECEECGSEISQKRLLARPTATLCINCQEHKERDERGSIKHRRDLKLLKTVIDRRDELDMERESKGSGFGHSKFDSIGEI